MSLPLPRKRSREVIAVFGGVVVAHLLISVALFAFVAPLAKTGSAGFAGIVLAVLLFPVYVLDSLGSDVAFPGDTFEWLYGFCFLLSAVLWAALITKLFTLCRRLQT
jgi:hypothetical protein